MERPGKRCRDGDKSEHRRLFSPAGGTWVDPELQIQLGDPLRKLSVVFSAKRWLFWLGKPLDSGFKNDSLTTVDDAELDVPKFCVNSSDSLAFRPLELRFSARDDPPATQSSFGDLWAIMSVSVARHSLETLVRSVQFSSVQNGNQLVNLNMRFGNEVRMTGGVTTEGSCDVREQSASNTGVPLWKRSLDITCVILASPVLVPVMVFLALLIKCASPGPVFFLHERVGYRGRRFICFKFRTMKANADSEIHRRHLADLMRSDSPMEKMDSKGDPRLIPFGSLLRATGLDELPQIFNVLGGEMSLVGPRPCLAYEYENYLPSQKRRFETLPGLTGLWQVSGKNKTTFSEMIALDIRYAVTKSPVLDLKIMLKTVPALVSQVQEVRAKKMKMCQPRMNISIRTLTPDLPKSRTQLLSPK
jgi:exopolysaccharide production protein ExoY